jgi:allantoin racemase
LKNLTLVNKFKIDDRIYIIVKGVPIHLSIRGEENTLRKIVCIWDVAIPKDYELRLQRLRSYARPDTTVDLRNVPNAPSLANLEYYSYETMVGRELLAANRKAEKEGYHAILQACWYDPGVREAREVLHIPIIGLCEASLHIASLLGHKFSIIPSQRKFIAKMSENVRRWGFESKIASWRALDLHVADLWENHDRTMGILLKVARRCIEEDGAEVIVPACGSFETYAKEASEILHVPVINSYMAGIMMAELLADLYLRGISASKIATYQAPPEEELRLLDTFAPK